MSESLEDILKRIRGDDPNDIRSSLTAIIDHFPDCYEQAGGDPEGAEMLVRTMTDLVIAGLANKAADAVRSIVPLLLRAYEDNGRDFRAMDASVSEYLDEATYKFRRGKG